MPLKTRKSLSILFVSDFFLPNIGGVELHQLHLAKELVKRGHRVSIFTRSYLARSDCDEDGGGEFTGVRYLECGAKVYYVPRVHYGGVALPTIFGILRVFRKVRACVRVCVCVWFHSVLFFIVRLRVIQLI